MQSRPAHRYMLGKLFYGWAGMIAGVFIFLYELFSPFWEILGLCTLLIAGILQILSLNFTLLAICSYSILVILIQMILIVLLDVYGLAPTNLRQKALLLCISIVEILVFHPMNSMIKLTAFFKYSQNKKTWKHIQRI